MSAPAPDRPLRILQQNTGLLYLGHRGWMPRKAALRRLIEELRDGDWDLVALSEVFRLSERDRIVEALADRYPHVVFGPEGGRFPPRLNGGLLLLSRQPLEHPRFLVCRDSAGIDAWANKGVAAARWNPAGWPAPLLLAFSHTQNPDATGPEANRAVTAAQLAEIGAWLQAEADPREPVLFFGDLNTDAHDRTLTAAPRAPESYRHLRRQLPGFVDLWEVLAPEGAPGITFDDAGTFRQGMARPFDHPGRHQRGQRIDHFLARAGRTGQPGWRAVRVELLPFEPGLELSDHYGLSLELQGWEPAP